MHGESQDKINMLAQAAEEAEIAAAYEDFEEQLARALQVERDSISDTD